jgi:hypothetical protein
LVAFFGRQLATEAVKRCVGAGVMAGAPAPVLDSKPVLAHIAA